MILALKKRKTILHSSFKEWCLLEPTLPLVTQAKRVVNRLSSTTACAAKAVTYDHA